MRYLVVNAAERELELRTPCDGRVRRFLDRWGIVLVGFGSVPRLLGPVM
jgi:hypothetical protein